MISSIVSYSRPRVAGELSMCTASLVVLGAVCPDYSCGALSQLDGMNVGKLHYSAYVAYCGFVWAPPPAGTPPACLVPFPQTQLW